MVEKNGWNQTLEWLRFFPSTPRPVSPEAKAQRLPLRQELPAQLHAVLEAEASPAKQWLYVWKPPGKDENMSGSDRFHLKPTSQIVLSTWKSTLPPTGMVTGGRLKRKLIFQVHSHEDDSGREGSQIGRSGRFPTCKWEIP